MTARPDLAVSIGDIRLKNPLICGAGEHLIAEGGLRAALDAGAAAVVMKSANESAAAQRQLDGADYVLVDSRHRALPWDFDPPADASLLCRSGLSPLGFDDWLDLAVRSDDTARRHDAYLVPSLIPADMETALGLARRVEAAGLRLIEINVGAPHASEAKAGAITDLHAADLVRDATARLRQAVSLPLWIKLSGQGGDVATLAAAARDRGADAVTIMGRFMAMLPDTDGMTPMLGTNAGYGGAWALPIVCRWLATARRDLGPAFPLIATNGARDGLDVARFLLAGAHAVQMTSAVMTGGFRVVATALDDLATYLASKDVDARELIGRAADALESYQDQTGRPGHWRSFVPPESREDDG